MVITIDQESQEPLYLQVRNQIIQAIAEGGLEPGEGLPSVRALAGDLGINLHTVNKAYAVLRDEGYLTMRGRRGAVVTNRASAAARRCEEEQGELMDEELRRLAVAHKARGGTYEEFVAVAARRAAEVFGEGGRAADFAAVLPGVSVAPAATAAPVTPAVPIAPAAQVCAPRKTR